MKKSNRFRLAFYVDALKFFVQINSVLL